MSTKSVVVRSAVVTAVGLALSGMVFAQAHPEKPTYAYEKCYGVAKAANNDCFKASNSCAGTTASDNQRDAWIYVPKGTCEKISGGSLDPK